jgi:hypothetical protein
MLRKKAAGAPFDGIQLTMGPARETAPLGPCGREDGAGHGELEEVGRSSWRAKRRLQMNTFRTLPEEVLRQPSQVPVEGHESWLERAGSWMLGETRWRPSWSEECTGLVRKVWRARSGLDLALSPPSRAI